MTHKTVFITGASSGIGLQMAKEFAKRGYNLALAARRIELLTDLKQQLNHLDVDIQCQQVDVTDEVDVKQMYQQAIAHFGRIDTVMVNAGMAKSGFISEQSFSDMRAMIDLNLSAAMLTAHHGLKQFRRQGEGHIVFISSLAGLRGMPGMAAYSASKAGISTFAEALRAETYRENIHVTTLCPGYINTPIGEDMDKRPFVISAEKAGKILTDNIENKVKRSYIPIWPWAFLARIIPFIPTYFFAKSK